MKRFLWFCLAVSILVACSSTSTPAPDTGVEGTVTIGPSCPVVREDQPCPDEPFQATFKVLTASGDEVTQFTTDENGQYHIALPPGNYILRTATKGVLPHTTAPAFTVTAGQFTKLDIVFDSGIR